MSQPPTSKYPDMGEVTTLRLELCRERDRANAFEAALKTDVLKVAKVAIYQAAIDAGKAADADTIGWMGVEVDDLRKENEKLKAEVKRLKAPVVVGGYNLSEYIRMANSETLEFDNGDIFADMTIPERIKYIVESHSNIKAEVERLRASSFVTAVPVEEYERLCKAGDAMAICLEAYNRCKPYDGPMTLDCLKSWLAAKEGKPSV